MTQIRTEKDKQILLKVISGYTLQRYNLTCFVNMLGISMKCLRANESRRQIMTYIRKTHKNKIGSMYLLIRLNNNK